MPTWELHTWHHHDFGFPHRIRSGDYGYGRSATVIIITWEDMEPTFFPTLQNIPGAAVQTSRLHTRA